MAQEIIDNIRAAELKSQQIIRDAEDQKKAIIQRAHDEVEAYNEQLLGEARQSAAEMISAAESTRDSELEAARRRAMAIIAQRKGGFENRKEEAIELIISEIC